MASQEGCVTVNWDIRNFSLFDRKMKDMENRILLSPEWVFEDTKGRVGDRWLRVYTSNAIFPNSPYPQSQISSFEFEFSHYRDRTEMFFRSPYGDVLLKTGRPSTIFYLPSSALFDKNGQSILLNDTMTLRCRTWGKTLKTSECHIATVLKSLNHLWTIEKLSSSDSHDTYIEQENAKLHVSLKRKEYDVWKFTVEREQHAPGGLYVVDCTLSMKDSCGRVSNHQMINFGSKKHSSPFYMDSITTRVTFQLELIVALHGRHELSASLQIVKETQLKPNSPTNTANHKNVSGALGDDFLLLYRDSAFSDATLNTEGKSFSAHKAVLAARSPVFRAMFEKDETSEGRSGVVDIDDVDSETMDRMLVYLYTDSIIDLAWKEASALYYAADKYEILPLKEKCADFLKDSLAADNACDVLVLADRHSDQELMTRVVDFILGHEEVVSSDQWGELEKGNSMLCAKIMRELFLKKGKK